MESTVSDVSRGFSFSANSLSSDLEKLIDPSPVKTASKALFSLITFFDNYVNFSPIIQTIVTYWKFIQLVGSALNAACGSFWKEGTLGFKSISIISVLFHLIPAAERDTCREMTMIVYIVVMALFFLVVIASALYYKFNGKLPYTLALLTNGFLFSFSILLPQIGTEMAGEEISKIIAKESVVTTKGVLLIMFSLIMTIANFLFHFFLCSQTIIFRMEPTPMLEGFCQSELSAMLILTTLLTSIASHLDSQIAGIISIVAAFVYLIGIRLVFYEGSFIILTNSYFFLASILTSCVAQLVIGVSLFIGFEGSETILFVFLILFVVFYIISYFWIGRKLKNDLITLDAIEENVENMQEIKTVSRIASLSITGFAMVHPNVISWNFFKAAMVQWPDNIRILVMYAKYSAIFPEDKSTLQLIGRTIAEQGTQSIQKDQALHQITAILRTREPNLTVELKQKISKMNNNITRTKHKMRNLWDILLQGNVKELVSGISIAYDSVCNCEIEMDQLLKQFPNNRFVSRIYARFLKDVKAEYAASKLWTERTKDLCLSKNTSDDIIHKAGITAFPNATHTIERVDSIQQSIDGDSETNDDQTSTTEEEQLFIGATIVSHKIQVVTWTNCLLAFNIVIFIVVPIVFLLIYFFTYIKNLAAPLDYMYAISYMRMLNFMFSSFGQRYCMEKLPKDPDNPNDPERLAAPIDFGDSDMQAFDGQKTITGQITHLLKESMEVSSKVDPIRDYAVGDARIDEARTILFTPSTTFKYYPNGYTAESQKKLTLPAETICITVSQYLSQLIELETLTKDDILSIMVLTATTNVLNPGKKLSEALTLFIQYISDNDARDQKIYVYVAVLISCLQFIAFLIMIIVLLRKFESNKKDIFGALSSLPKTVISTISASFSVIEKKQTSNSTVSDPDNELNKQEEKAIKMFTSISDDSGGINGIYIIIVASLLIVVCGVVAVVRTCLVYREMSTVLIENAPHIDYLGGAMSYIGGMFNNMGRLVLGANGYREYEQSSPGSLTTFYTRLQTYIDYYHKARFGGSGSREFPFIGMIDGLDYASSRSTCPDTITRMRDTFMCLDSDLQAYFLRNIMHRIVIPVEKDENANIPMTGTGYDEMWFLALHLYNTLFEPMMSQMTNTIAVDLDNGISPIVTISVSMLICVLILYIIALLSLKKVNNQLKFGIGLLKFCPDSAIHSSPRIMALLSGNYGYKQDDTTERNSAYYDTLVNKLSDIVIICKSTDFSITTTNAAFDQIFEREPNSCIGLNVKNFFQEVGMKGRIEPIFEKSCSSLLTYQKGDDIKYIAFTSATIGEFIYINGRDQTREMMHMQLIQDERSKSDAMLRTIIPVSLVSRVQAGETNISFSVQSASVLFLDIVSFTPWCGSSTAQHVMLTLNTIFSMLDEAIATRDSLMRVKCIGDCYMAAGGIFTEGNHPEVHAREMAEFGIDAIKVLGKVNEQLGENLQIRVGINTGGPIVAGVIGTAKPTFEILGPAINMAQQMEHTGVPMQVQITRAVYELIYGGTFKIKERGEVEVKGKKVSTYLIIPE